MRSSSLGLVLVLGSVPTARAEPPRAVLYELSSPDVGVAWHLHARGGELLCELPCEQWIGERSGSYLVVHDPIKAWKVKIPSSPPRAAARVEMEPRVGKGSPALGAAGTVFGVVGGASLAAGTTLLLMTLFDAASLWCPSGSSPDACSRDVGTVAGLGGIFVAVGLTLGISGFYLAEHNKASSVRIRVLPTGVVGSF